MILYLGLIPGLDGSLQTNHHPLDFQLPGSYKIMSQLQVCLLVSYSFTLDMIFSTQVENFHTEVTS